METSSYKASLSKTWTVIVLLVLLILSLGAISYRLVGDRGQPDWDYRPVKDVPGESAYSLYAPLPFPQHVRGDRGK